MAETLTSQDLSARPELADWRVIRHRLEATFHAGAFDTAAAFAAEIGAAAQAADHHPDIDLRYPDVVHIVCTTHSDGGVTDLDVALATAISAMARSAGYSNEPTAAQVVEIGIDAMDIPAIRPFWQAVLGYEAGSGEEWQVGDLVDPAGAGPAVWFQQMDAPRPQRNRIHFDVNVAHDVAEQRVADAIAAGGRLLDDSEAKAFWVLADPEGNEACVCTWQDRD